MIGIGQGQAQQFSRPIKDDSRDGYLHESYLVILTIARWSGIPFRAKISI